jgi:DNA-binding NtrC family response regulator
MAARILLIDDDAGIRESMRMPLEYEGYEYSSSASAEEGIAAIQRESPDIVFLDI